MDIKDKLNDLINKMEIQNLGLGDCEETVENLLNIVVDRIADIVKPDDGEEEEYDEAVEENKTANDFNEEMKRRAEEREEDKKKWGEKCHKQTTSKYLNAWISGTESSIVKDKVELQDKLNVLYKDIQELRRICTTTNMYAKRIDMEDDWFINNFDNTMDTIEREGKEYLRLIDGLCDYIKEFKSKIENGDIGTL